ncbi:VOC family protein [Flectobacillus major]|uniref:VOC family protein n=1 Tax=Flectobacillus major TaxID=103 RepID=UPI0004285117|nr:VOC family protein [Flectobacillus major]
MIKFAYTILYVSDVEKSVAFYEKAFQFSLKFISPDSTYAELITGETTLSFAHKELASSNLPEGFQESSLSTKPFAIEIGFATENVENLLEQAIQAGGILVAAPKQKPWGQTVAYVRDLEGFLIELCTPMA